MQLEVRNWVLEEDQRIATRKPGEVETLAHGSTKKVSWHVAEVLFRNPRLGLWSLVVMSTHLNCKYAKRPVAGPEALQEAVDAAMAECDRAGRLGLDIVRGDINMARPPLSSLK